MCMLWQTIRYFNKLDKVLWIYIVAKGTIKTHVQVSSKPLQPLQKIRCLTARTGRHQPMVLFHTCGLQNKGAKRIVCEQKSLGGG